MFKSHIELAALIVSRYWIQIASFIIITYCGYELAVAFAHYCYDLVTVAPRIPN